MSHKLKWKHNCFYKFCQCLLSHGITELLCEYIFVHNILGKCPNRNSYHPLAVQQALERLFLDVARDKATYNCPWEKRIREVDSNIWYCLPCALFMVITKHSLIGNCFLLNLKGNISSSDWHNGIRGRKPLFPGCCPNTILTFIKFSGTTYYQHCSVTQTISWIQVP